MEFSKQIKTSKTDEIIRQLMLCKLSCRFLKLKGLNMFGAV